MISRLFSGNRFHSNIFFSNTPNTPNTPNTQKKSKIACVFDIDGVWMRGGTMLPEAKKLLPQIHSNLKEFGSPFPFDYLFMTNAGGTTESQKAIALESVLGFPVPPEKVILAHTPVKSMVPWLNSNDSSITQVPENNTKNLIVGEIPSSLLETASSYGIQNPVALDHILEEHPLIWPKRKFYKLMDPNPDTELIQKSRELARDTTTGYKSILVFHCPADFGASLQVIVDLINYGGLIHSPDQPLDFPDLQDFSPLLVFCNPDFFYMNEYGIPRFTMESFRSCIKIICHQSRIHDPRFKAHSPTIHIREQWQDELWPGLEHLEPIPNEIRLGKPGLLQFRFAEHLLQSQSIATEPLPHSLSLLDDCISSITTRSPDFDFDKIFMVGDNATTDIAGALNAGDPWHPILVSTGVDRVTTTEEMFNSHPGLITRKNSVYEAVNWISEMI